MQLLFNSLLEEAKSVPQGRAPYPTSPAEMFRLAVSRSGFFQNRELWDGWNTANGRVYVLCVFHRERTPSLVIYPKTEIWDAHYHCYGCGAEGTHEELIRFRLSKWL